jgi:hypothetical protein
MTTVDFTTFLSGFTATAAVALDEVQRLLEPETGTENGETGSTETDEAAPSAEERAQRIQAGLATAQQLIDTLVMLEEKTKGNLTDDERRLLQATLTELRFGYVRLLDRSRAARQQ